MSVTPSRDDATVRREASLGESIGPIVDWMVAIFLGLVGLTIAVGGLFGHLAANREEIATLVADESITVSGLTEAELVEVTYALAWWGGLGLVVLGLVIAAVGVAYLTIRRRKRSRLAAEDVPMPTAGTYAIVGGIVTAVTSFVPLSPILGGAVAGYLEGGENGRGLTVGGMAGLVAAVPLVVGVVVAMGGLAIATATIGFGFVAVAIAMGIALGAMIAALYVVALSALGGFLGASVEIRRRHPPAASRGDPDGRPANEDRS